jgi:hypothetical protein
MFFRGINRNIETQADLISIRPTTEEIIIMGGNTR